MTISIELEGSLGPFSGRAPLFPLPNVVFFPRLLLPLHVFEPRYRAMTEEALAGEKLIAMALLKPGWETAAAHEVPEVFDTVCLGRIVASERQPDGRWHLVLHGLTRARILEDERDEKPYRTARMELLNERLPSREELDVEARRGELLDAFRKLFPQFDLETVLHPAASAEVSLGVLCDVLASAMRPGPLLAQRFLEALDVRLRSVLLLECLRQSTAESVSTKFPPRFSRN